VETCVQVSPESGTNRWASQFQLGSKSLKLTTLVLTSRSAGTDVTKPQRKTGLESGTK